MGPQVKTRSTAFISERAGTRLAMKYVRLGSRAAIPGTSPTVRYLERLKACGAPSLLSGSAANSSPCDSRQGAVCRWRAAGGQKLGGVLKTAEMPQSGAVAVAVVVAVAVALQDARSQWAPCKTPMVNRRVARRPHTVWGGSVYTMLRRAPGAPPGPGAAPLGPPSPPPFKTL